MEWISVNDIMPPQEWVLAFSKDDACHVAYYDYGYKTWVANSKFGDDVTHWMPLPDPPK